MKKEIASGLAIDPAETNMYGSICQQQILHLLQRFWHQQADDAAEREAASADDAMDSEIKKAKAMPKPSHLLNKLY